MTAQLSPKASVFWMLRISWFVAGALGVSLCACSPFPEKAPVSQPAPKVSGPRTDVASESAPAKLLTPEELATKLDSAQKLPALVPAPTPPADPSLVVVQPRVEEVRRYLLKNVGHLAQDIELRPVVLDFDREDEYIARATLRIGQEVRAKWVLLLDKRGDHYVLLRAWTPPNSVVEDRIIANGRGGRALLVLQTRQVSATSDSSAVSLWSLDAQGNLQSHKAPGQQDRDVLVPGARPHQFLLRTSGGKSNAFRLRASQEGFELVKDTAAP